MKIHTLRMTEWNRTTCTSKKELQFSIMCEVLGALWLSCFLADISENNQV